MALPTWMKVKDICADLGIHRATWYRWVADPEMNTPEPISGIGRLVRYRRDQYEAFRNSIDGLADGPQKLENDNNQQLQHASAK